jgi:hypothetical protein
LALPEEEIGYSLKYLYEYLEKTVLLLALWNFYVTKTCIYQKKQ